MKIKKLFFVTIFIFAGTLSAWEPCTRHLVYAKAGSDFGVGYRGRRHIHGWDLSLYHSAWFDETWTGGKALYLFYPFSSPFYLGAGLGIVHGTYDVTYRGDSSPSLHTTRTYPACETVIGYEFCTNRKIKLFTQFELTLPSGSVLLEIFPRGPGASWKPALTVGIGY